MSRVKSTTIIAVYSESERTAVVASDGQATLDTTIIKKGTKKVYRLHDETVLVGFAGATADCLALLEKFEGKLKKYDGQLRRSAVELTKEWRTDRMLRHLEAVIVAASKEGLLMISGVGDVLEPDGGIIGIGSGGAYALAAAKGLCAASDSISPEETARHALQIAAEIDIYTNDQITLEKIHW